MDDFKRLKEKAREIPEVRNYLDSFTTELARSIFKRRIKLGWSQQELADRAEVTQATISRIEGGDTGIKGETYNKVIRAMDVNKTKIFFEEEIGASREDRVFVSIHANGATLG